ncbi:hypothetical protein SEA_NITZEL_52 [Mycobacterium phage Nitzel]|uniref:Uncharacterized protein n=1 Tax=Mycobacterium phage Nitzel TaxID=2652404 RepID=A0A5J6T3Z6_9CAUD|nr:hypothetical protein I5H70_gp52 [Mycobacterium phage Nitzel]QFG04878.1 hypothetical protein SEA_NITZEL_52 [Mycobacterium phage Nitzel]
MTITVHTQAELDQALTDRADVIYIESDPGVWLRLSNSGSARVVAWGSARVEAWGANMLRSICIRNVSPWMPRVRSST